MLAAAAAAAPQDIEKFTNPDFVAALDHVAAVARAHGKGAGMLVRDAAEVAGYHARGFTFLGIGSDSGLVATGARTQLAAARAALAGPSATVRAAGDPRLDAR